MRKTHILIGIIGLLVFLSTYFFIYLHNNKNMACDIKVKKSKYVEPQEVFKNDHIYIKEGTDTFCKDYKNNLEYYENELNKDYVNSSETSTFIYYDINTKFSYGYKEDVEIPTASTIKTALVIYIMDQVAQGKASLDKLLTYTSAFSNSGSGILKNDKVGKQYTVKTLIEDTVIYSDNIAYLMLLKEFGYTNVQKYWFNLGTTTTYAKSQKWGTVTAKDGLIYMKRLYQFYREDNTYGVMLMNIFKEAKFRYVTSPDLNNIEIAHKSGFTPLAANDFDIIFDKNPFIYIVLTKKNGMGDTGSFFPNVTSNVYKLHRYYWDNIGCLY